MNKFVIIALACCLISVHAFVKRDAGTDPVVDLGQKAQKMFEDFKKELDKAFAPENVNKQASELAERFNAFMAIFKENPKP